MLWSFYHSSCFFFFFPCNHSFFQVLLSVEARTWTSQFLYCKHESQRQRQHLTHPVSPLHRISFLEQHYTGNSCSSCHLAWPWDFVRGTAQGWTHHLEKCSLFLTPRWKPGCFLNSTLFAYVDVRESTLMWTFKSVWFGALVRINSFSISTAIKEWQYIWKKEKDFDVQVKWEKDHA